MERKKYTIQNGVIASHCRISHLAENSAEFWELVLITSPDDNWQGSRGYSNAGPPAVIYSTQKEYLRMRHIQYDVCDNLPYHHNCVSEKLWAKKNLVNTFEWELVGLNMWPCSAIYDHCDLGVNLIGLQFIHPPTGDKMTLTHHSFGDQMAHYMQKAFGKCRYTNKMPALRRGGGSWVLKRRRGDLVALICERHFPLVIRSLEGVQPLPFPLGVGTWIHIRQNAQWTVCVPPPHAVTTPAVRIFMPCTSLWHIRPSSVPFPCPPQQGTSRLQCRQEKLILLGPSVGWLLCWALWV